MTKNVITGPYLIEIHLQSGETAWYWIRNKNSTSPISPVFKRRKDAEKWLDDFVSTYEIMSDLIDRCKNGKFYKIKATIQTDVIEGIPPFTITINADDGSISTKILAKNLEEARNIFTNYFEVIEWIE